MKIVRFDNQVAKFITMTIILVEWTYIETGDKKIRWQGCPDGGCNYELAIQLMITMVGKQIYNNLAEVVTPWLKQLWTRFRQVSHFNYPGRTVP